MELFDWIAERSEAYIYSGKLTVALLRMVNPKLVISYNYSHIVDKDCINEVHDRIINMHISYLPYNRGASPNLWSFIDDTPKGVTIHMLTEGLDEGDILFQKEIDFVAAEENFQTTHTKLNQEIVKLFKHNWKEIITGDYKELRRPQRGMGSYHTIADLKKLRNEISFDWSENIQQFLYRYDNR